MTNHVLFVHGVNENDPNYAQDLISLINARSITHEKIHNISLKWYDTTKEQEKTVLTELQASKSVWDGMWFKNLREHDLLQFVGDAALYLSQHIAADAISALHEEMAKELSNYDEKNDALHIVAHSWGSVILFDILFAARWDKTDCNCDRRNNDEKIVNAINQVDEIRSKFWGLGADEKTKYTGIKIGSISTMGSPIAFYSLIVASNSSHDISQNLNSIVRDGLVWQNFIHRGDLIACPLEKLLSDIFKEENQDCIKVKDFLTNNSLSEPILNMLNLTKYTSPLVAGNAHSSYWKSEFVAQKIAELTVACTEIK